MSDQYLIGVDIGTQGVKAGLFRMDGRCLADGFEPSRLYQPSPGITEEDPDFQVDSMCRIVSDCVKSSGVNPGDVAALAVDGQMAGIIGIGEDGKAVTPYDSWLDTRCAPWIGEMKTRAGEEITRKTGNTPSFNHGPKKLWWMNERSDEFRKISKFVQPGAYAAMQLCGLDADQAFIDHTYLHFSGFADNQRGVWDSGLCSLFEFPVEKLPRIIDPERIVGTLTNVMARNCSLTSAVPVVAGCGDTAASFLACGATEKGICIDVAGTASVFAATTSEFRPDVDDLTLGIGRSATPGLWHPYAYINGGGLNLEWYRKDILGFMRDRNLEFRDLDQSISDMELTDDLPLFIPHMAGRVSPGQPALRGTFTGLNWTHSAAHLYRAVLEGVALEYGIYTKILRGLYGDSNLKEIRVTGGGQNSDVWNRMKSAVLDIPVRKIKNSMGAPMGSAMLAGYGAGIFPSLKDAAAAWVEVTDTVTDTGKNREYYDRRIITYERLLNTINNFLEKSKS